MKKIFIAVSAVVVMASCSQNNPRPEAETKTLTPVDTAGLAQFQAWKAQNELAVAQQAVQQEQPVREVVRERVVYVNEPRRSTRSSRSSSGTASRSNGSSGTSGAGTSSGTETGVEEKKGMSKAAKGAIIGGAGGAVAGAVINKRNRAVGAVIGGVVGGAVGYGIGKSKDNKDGRN